MTPTQVQAMDIYSMSFAVQGSAVEEAGLEAMWKAYNPLPPNGATASGIPAPREGGPGPATDGAVEVQGIDCTVYVNTLQSFGYTQSQNYAIKMAAIQGYGGVTGLLIADALSYMVVGASVGPIGAAAGAAIGTVVALAITYQEENRANAKGGCGGNRSIDPLAFSHSMAAMGNSGASSGSLSAAATPLAHPMLAVVQA